MNVAKPKMSADAVSGVWAGPWGRFAWSCTNTGMCRLQFPEPNQQIAKTNRNPPLNRHVNDLIAWLEEWLGGDPQSAVLPALDVSAGTEFQRDVWTAMSRIPFGETRSYQQLATDIGRPGAIRAVGGACGANPVPLLVPCHRVTAAGGRIGGFSAPGGIVIKQRLLTWEQRATRGAAATTIFEF